jgi:hypothetical protein
MISVADAFSVEEVDSVRKIAQSIQFAWKRDYLSTIRFFTIGVSRIGGSDIIPDQVAAATAWNKYKYTDESAYTLGLGYERQLNMPIGGLTVGLADIRLDNTSGRFSPRYVGGTSELYTAVDKPGRPVVINAGFNYGGIDNMIPQFVGLTSKPPLVDMRQKTAELSATDFMGYIQDSYVDKTAMFTADRTDVLIESALQSLGFATSQYDLDPGINIVRFGLFNTGLKWGDYIDQLAKSEYGHIYQDETGRIRFDNRQKWSNYPYFNVQRVITTSQVINAVVPNTDHIINVVEVKSSPRTVQSTQLIWQAAGYAGSGVIALPAGSTEVWANYNDPVYNVDTPVASGTTSKFIANTLTDGTGSDVTSSVSLKSITNFAQASKLVFTNSSSSVVYLTTLDIWGRPARKTGDIYYKEKNDSSVTAYGERPLVVENDYIQDSSWAQSYAGMILQDFAHPENLQELTIRAMPELQLGDLISWQGHYWRVYDIKTQIDPGVGFIQDLKLLQRTIVTYFRIGVSTIGSADKIAP